MRMRASKLRTHDASRREYYLDWSGFGYVLQPGRWPEFHPLNNQLGRWASIAAAAGDRSRGS
jgi:hypothetical protein